MGCSTIYHYLFTHPLYPSTVNGVGIVSEKPKLGRGNGGRHVYHSHFASIGYAGACYMTRHLFMDFVEYLIRRDLTTAGNCLYISEKNDNVYEARNYHMFFKTDADIFVFKSYLTDAPDKLKIRQGNAIIEPYLYRFI